LTEKKLSVKFSTLLLFFTLVIATLSARDIVYGSCSGAKNSYCVITKFGNMTAKYCNASDSGSCHQ
jgi:hypothetical protein